MKTPAAAHLAENVRSLRRARSWTQQQLSERAGIPRSTLASMESGAGNPSLTNLASVSAALGAGIEELLARPRSDCLLIRAADVPARNRSRGRVVVTKILPERIRGMEIDRIALAAGSSMGGTPHVTGTKEYFYCLTGGFQVLVNGQLFEVGTGDVLAFPGDQRHSYRNHGAEDAAAISVVVPVPVGASAPLR
jgi:transcriptional regulator with XRE-family HTH domain